MRQLVPVAQLIGLFDEAGQLRLCIRVTLTRRACLHEVPELLPELPEDPVLKGLEFAER